MYQICTINSLSALYEMIRFSATSHPAGKRKVKVKEVDLYSAFIEVPYTQGAQVRITQCYLQITPYLLDQCHGNVLS